VVSTGNQIPRGLTLDPPRAAVDKPFLLSEGRVELEASLDKATYHHGEPILVTVTVNNNSGKTVRRIKVGAGLWKFQCGYTAVGQYKVSKWTLDWTIGQIGRF